MKISITGGNGFIGSHLIDKLLARGAEISCLVRRTSNLRWLEGKKVRLIEGDMQSHDALRELVIDADYVYHNAGIVKSKTRDGYFEGNTVATKNILDACKRYSTHLSKFIFISSQTAVGPSPDLEHPVDESTPCRPITAYGESKKAAEEVVLSMKHELPVTIVRPPAVYGPRDTEIFIFFQTIRKGLNPMIGFDDKRVSLIHVHDLVDGIILAGESSRSNAQTYFISSEEYYGWKECGRLAAEKMGKQSPLRIRVPHFVVYAIAAIAQLVSTFQKQAATLNIEKARDITRTYWTCSTAKAMQELGYRQRTSLAQGFENTIQWYFDQGWLKK